MLSLCPVCGSPSRIVHEPTFAWCTANFYVECTNPNCNEKTAKFESKSEATEAWNNRNEH